jgi:hypothetical protein
MNEIQFTENFFQSKSKSKLDNESPRDSQQQHRTEQTTKISFNFFIALLVATNNSVYTQNRAIGKKKRKNLSPVTFNFSLGKKERKINSKVARKR